MTQGAIHNLGELLLLLHVRASRYLPSREPTTALVARRNATWTLSAHELMVGAADVDAVVPLLRTLGLPMRQPRIIAAAGNITGWQQLWLWVSLDGAAGATTMALQYGGADGEDAPVVRQLLERLLVVAGISAEHPAFRVLLLRTSL